MDLHPDQSLRLYAVTETRLHLEKNGPRHTSPVDGAKTAIDQLLEQAARVEKYIRDGAGKPPADPTT
jgi:hypothetical protein